MHWRYCSLKAHQYTSARAHEGDNQYVSSTWRVNTLMPRQYGRHIADNIFKCIFLNENIWIFIKIPLNIVPKGRINYIPALVQIMAWRWWGIIWTNDGLVYWCIIIICFTRPPGVKISLIKSNMVTRQITNLVTLSRHEIYPIWYIQHWLLFHLVFIMIKQHWFTQWPCAQTVTSNWLN